MKKILTSFIVAGFLTNTLLADTTTNKINKNAVIKAEQNAQNENKLVKEAINAIRDTQEALFYLNANKISKAKEAIKKAIGDLSDVLNRPNPPYLLPIDTKIEAYEFRGDLNTVTKTLAQAKLLIMENKLPQARAILNTLRDEIVIKTTNLPLVTYPAALNLSIKYINEEKVKEAKDVLVMALSTLVEVKSIIPIPLIKAQALIEEASKIVKTNRKETLKILGETKYQLKLAEILGYTSKSSISYRELKKDIEKLEKEIKAHHKTTSLFERLIQKLKEFKEKAISQSSK